MHSLRRVPQAARVVAATLLGMLCCMGVLAILQVSPAMVLRQWVDGMLSRPRYALWCLVTACPLILYGLSMWIAREAGLWNLGLQGQVIVSAMAAAWIGTRWQIPMVVHPLLVMLAAMLAGAAWGALCGGLKALFGVHEVAGGWVLSGIAVVLNNQFLASPGMQTASGEPAQLVSTAGSIFLYTWKNSLNGQAFLEDVPILQDLARVPLSWIVFLIPVVVGLTGYLGSRMRIGYEWRAIRRGPAAAQAAGIGVRSRQVIALAWAGAFAGLAAAVSATGEGYPQALASQQFSLEPALLGMAVLLFAGQGVTALLPAGLWVGAMWYSGGKLGSPPSYVSTDLRLLWLGAALCVLALPRADRLPRFMRKARRAELQATKKGKESADGKPA